MLFPSTLVICHDLSKIDSLLLESGHHQIENDPDIFLVTEYTVENIRQIKKFLSRQAYSHSSKLVIIPDAHLLNLESQNTLLKNLEEPGDSNHFILVTSQPNALLSTIISRCHQIKINETSTQQTIQTFPKSTAEALALTDSMAKDKQSVQNFLEQQLSAYQKQLIGNPQLSPIVKRITKAILLLNANIDSKTVLDFLFLGI